MKVFWLRRGLVGRYLREEGLGLVGRSVLFAVLQEFHPEQKLQCW